MYALRSSAPSPAPPGALVEEGVTAQQHLLVLDLARRLAHPPCRLPFTPGSTGVPPPHAPEPSSHARAEHT